MLLIFLLSLSLFSLIKYRKSPFTVVLGVFPSEGSSQGTVEYRRERSEWGYAAKALDYSRSDQPLGRGAWKGFIMRPCLSKGAGFGAAPQGLFKYRRRLHLFLRHCWFFSSDARISYAQSSPSKDYKAKFCHMSEVRTIMLKKQALMLRKLKSNNGAF